jgi:hypothetical protein
MDAKVIRIEIKFTRITLAVLLGSLLLAVGLMIATGALAQPSESPKGNEQLEVADYDPSLLPRLPREMNYQGILRDGDENLIDGPHDLTFTIYKWYLLPVPGQWAAVYSETHEGVQINDGLFNVTIGSEEPLDPGDFGGWWFLGGSLELGVSVDGGDELSPRADLLPVPYAFRAEYVNRFPAPHYDSGWEDLGTRVDPIQVGFTHNLGGSPDDYVVDLECKGSMGTHQCHDDHAYWHDLTDTEITVWATNSSIIEQIRVRIWRID